jgi:hypothetical protein
LIVETTNPIFTPEQCLRIIEAGREEPIQEAAVGGGNGGVIDTKTRTSHISWIPFPKMPEMYKVIETMMKKTNNNHFGFRRNANNRTCSIYRISCRWILRLAYRFRS